MLQGQRVNPQFHKEFADEAPSHSHSLSPSCRKNPTAGKHSFHRLRDLRELYLMSALLKHLPEQWLACWCECQAIPGVPLPPLSPKQHCPNLRPGLHIFCIPVASSVLSMLLQHEQVPIL